MFIGCLIKDDSCSFLNSRHHPSYRDSLDGCFAYLPYYVLLSPCSRFFEGFCLSQFFKKPGNFLSFTFTSDKVFQIEYRVCQIKIVRIIINIKVKIHEKGLFKIRIISFILSEKKRMVLIIFHFNSVNVTMKGFLNFNPPPSTDKNVKLEKIDKKLFSSCFKFTEKISKLQTYAHIFKFR